MLPTIRLLIALILCLPVCAHAEVLVLTGNSLIEIPSDSVQYLTTQNAQLGVEKLKSIQYQNQFGNLSESSFNFGRNKGFYWLRFTINKQSDLTWYLVVDSTILSSKVLYISQENGSVVQKKPYFEYQNIRMPTYRLDIKNNKNYTVYLRVSNKGKSVLDTPLVLMSADHLVKKSAYEYLFIGSMMMGIIVMAIYNLFLFFRLKDYNYLALSFTQISITLLLQRLNNLIPWLSPMNDPDNFMFYIVFLIFIISSASMLRSLLVTKYLTPRTDKLLLLLIFSSIVFFPFIKMLPRGDILSFSAGCVIALCAVSLMLKKVLEGNVIVKAFFMATSVFIAGALPIVFWGLGLDISFNLASTIFHTASFVASIMMSLALAEKTRQMKLQSDEARAANQAKTEFLTTMSHELRTPMHAVIGVGSLLKLTSLSNQQKNYVDKLDASSRHMMSIIERVLDLSRLENNTVSIEKKPFKIKDITARVENLLSDQARQKGLSLYMHSHYSETQLLEGDPTRLAQVLLNLLGNAIKFTDRGYITLLITPLEVPQSGQVTLTFEVIDTGSGLTQKQQQMLFKPFTQVDRSRTRKKGGFGLGLAISYKLVGNMGGYLEVDSTYGNGSRFFFTLTFPVIDSEIQGVGVSSSESNHSLSGIRILLVDDDEINRFLGLELLQALHAKVSVADSGRSALQILEHGNFDLILIDISMPEMDGYETTRRIRAMKKHRALPVIALTAHAVSGERERCLAAGMNDYLTKPFETVDLLNMIRFWTSSSTP